MSSGLPRVLCELPSDESVEAELAQLAPLAEALGHAFARPALLRVALTVGSWANEHRESGWPSNACLEFFGDAPPPEAPHWRARVELRPDDGEVEILGEGEGRSLRAAERDAALAALAALSGGSVSGSE